MKEKEALEASLKALSIQQLEDDPEGGKARDDGEGAGEDEAAQEGTVEESGEKDSSLASYTLLHIVVNWGARGAWSSAPQLTSCN